MSNWHAALRFGLAEMPPKAEDVSLGTLLRSGPDASFDSKCRNQLQAIRGLLDQGATRLTR